MTNNSTTSHLPDDDLQQAMQAAFACLPHRLNTLDVAAFIHGLLDGYNLRGDQRIKLLMQLVQSTDGISSVETDGGVILVSGNLEEPQTRH